ncbi:MAG: hypothetical protein ACI9BD_000301 [Candidatus Marinamargulisbacteria bacterium]|jgi:hypothetical protein
MYMPSAYVAEGMDNLCDFINRELAECLDRKACMLKGDDYTPVSESISQGNPLILASKIYEIMSSIHPYIDGNGRTSRLIMDFVMEVCALSPLCPKQEYCDSEVATFGGIVDTHTTPATVSESEPGDLIDEINSASMRSLTFLYQPDDLDADGF